MNDESTFNLQEIGLVMRPDLLQPLSGVFHKISHLIPERQELLAVRSAMSVTDALQLMKSRGFSQLPITEGTRCIGVFSFRSFSLGILQLSKQKIDPLDLTVGDFADDLPFVSVSDAFDGIIDTLDKNDAVLVGTPDMTQALLTTIDVLRYLYGVTSPYVLVAEIELGIRGLLRRSANENQFAEMCENLLKTKYLSRPMPRAIDNLEFNDYVMVITHAQSWPLFQSAFGFTRAYVRTKLERVGKLRNDLFHFRRGITLEEHEELVGDRDWLLRRSRILENKRSPDK